MKRELSNDGLKFIEWNEGLRLTAYQDSVGVWTVGYGHTGPEVREGMTVSGQMAEALLQRDVAKCVSAVNQLVTVPLTQGQFDALVDFAFNLGPGALKSSTLLRLLNRGDYAGAAKEFLKWDHAGGKVLPGLTKRCQGRKVMFESEEVQPIPAPTPDALSTPQPEPSFLQFVFSLIKGLFK